MGIAVKDSVRSPARISTRVAVGSARARATGSDQAGGSRPSQGRPGMAVTCTWISSAKTRLARRTIPWASIMQMAWVMASTVFSHSRFAEERSSTSRAFSRAMAAWASTAVTSVSSGLPKAPASSCERLVSRANNSTAGRGVAGLEGGLGMILANVRGRLRVQDFRLVALALARGDAVRREHYERLLLEQGPDRVLDERGLLEALLVLRSLVVPSPALFAYVAVRHTLLSAGVDDRELADYLAALVLEFGDHDRHSRIGRADDQTYHYLVDMVGELTGVDDAGERGFLLRVHLGNYSLWLAGLFPDYVEARRSRQGGPDLPYYDELGRQGYRLASEHRLAERFGVAEIYRAAAQRFPTLRVAFNRLSDRVFFPHVSTPEKILRNL